MIAQPNPHFETGTLSDLLDDKLEQTEAAQVHSHLDDCEICRGRLDEVAGQPQWWKETVQVLSATTKVDSKKSLWSSSQRSSSRNTDASLDWIRPLLDPGQGDEIGRIDQYLVQDIVGQGGMGVVLRGIDPDLNRMVAINVLSPHLSGIGAARARFTREAQAAAAIIHPSIVPIYSIATTGRLPYIVMPYIAGGNLQERIDREGPLELTEVMRIALQVAEGIAAAHRQGVIHRDIKPANILVEEGNGRVLISDFGLAHALDDVTLTMSGMIAGTPQFMSPEQAQGEHVDVRTDLFSFGSLIYALSTGHPPFRGSSPLAVLRKVSSESPRPIQHINERMPAWLDRIAGQLMRAEPAKRIQTADEAANLVRSALTHLRNPSANALPKSLAATRSLFPVVATTVIATIAVVVIADLVGATQNRSARAVSNAQRTTSSVQTANTRSIAVRPENDLDWTGQFLSSGLQLLNSEISEIGATMGIPVEQHASPILNVPPTTQENDQ